MVEYVERVDFDSRVRVRFGGRSGRVRWFVVQLEYNPAPWSGDDWKPVARFDHQPDSPGGHDVYEEGLHVDLFLSDGTKLKIYPDHGRLPTDPGSLLGRCKRQLKREYEHLRSLHLDDE